MENYTVNLMCYAWEVAKRSSEPDSLTSKGAEVLKHCFDTGASVEEAALELDTLED